MFELLWWQQLMLGVVFVADLAVLTNLVKNELNDWRLAHAPKSAPPTHGHPAH